MNDDTEPAADMSIYLQVHKYWTWFVSKKTNVSPIRIKFDSHRKCKMRTNITATEMLQCMLIYFQSLWIQIYKQFCDQQLRKLIGKLSERNERTGSVWKNFSKFLNLPNLCIKTSIFLSYNYVTILSTVVVICLINIWFVKITKIYCIYFC